MFVFVLAGVLFGGLCRFGGALGLVFGCGFLVVGLVVCCWGVFVFWFCCCCLHLVDCYLITFGFANWL